MNDRPSVSVIIPAHNEAKVLGKCLSALAAQTLEPLEIIVIDDHSDDSTASVARGFAGVTVVSAAGRGAGAARNEGAALARGDILAFTDADCVPPPNWLEKIVSDFVEKKLVAWGGGYSEDLSGSFYSRFAHLELQYRRLDYEGFVWTAVSNNFAVRTESFRAAGGFPVDFQCASLEDLVLTYHLSLREGRPSVWFSKEIGVGHHFKKDLKGYLRQQFVFARDTLLTFRLWPKIMLVKTHQGRKLHLSVAGTGLSLVLLAASAWNPLFLIGFAACLAGLGLIYLPFFRWFLYNEPLENIPKAAALQYLRDFFAGLGILAGIIRALQKPTRKSPEKNPIDPRPIC